VRNMCDADGAKIEVYASDSETNGYGPARTSSNNVYE